MSAEHDELRAVAERFDAVEPISVDEIERRAASSGDVDLAPPARRITPAMVIAAAAVVIGVVGVVVVAFVVDDEPDTVRTLDEPPAPTAETPATTPTATEASPPATTTPPATTDAPPATTTPAPTAREQLAEVERLRIAALQELAGYTAAVTNDSSFTPNDPTAPPHDPPAMVHQVTVLADGSMWATDDVGFKSYDPATGIAKGTFADIDGNIRHQEIVGQGDNFTSVSVVIGLDPTAPIRGPSDVVAVEEAVVDGRSAWRITVAERYHAADDESAATYVVDRETGLVISYVSEGHQPDGLWLRSTDLGEVGVVDEVPTAFPGSFPAGALIDRSGDPNAGPVSIAEAAEFFGPGFVAPLDGRVVSIATRPLGDGQTSTSTLLEVRFRIDDGFVSSSVTLGKSVPVPGEPLADQAIVVDGAICTDKDGDGECDQFDTGDTVNFGALAGGAVRGEDTLLLVHLPPIDVTIVSHDPVLARKNAESFVVP